MEWRVLKDCYGNCFSWYTALKTTAFYHWGLNKNTENRLLLIVFRLKNFLSRYVKIS